MVLKKKGSKAKGKKDLEIRDVVVHLQHMEQRLTSRMDGMDRKIDKNSVDIQKLDQRLSLKIDANTSAIEDLSLRIDALDKDLMATMDDTFKIRKHVGMAVVEE